MLNGTEVPGHLAVRLEAVHVQQPQVLRLDTRCEVHGLGFGDNRLKPAEEPFDHGQARLVQAGGARKLHRRLLERLGKLEHTGQKLLAKWGHVDVDVNVSPTSRD